MDLNKKTFQNADNFKSDLILSGVFLAGKVEHRSWVKDGVQKEMDVLAFFVQTDKDIFVCRSFNPKYQFADFKAGDTIVVPISEYHIDNMVKTVTVRV